MTISAVRVAVFGGRFGAQVHAEALRAVPGVEVVGVVDSGLDARRSEALWDLDLDAVTVAVPPMEQPPIVRRALDRGLHVLAEKPLAASAGEAHALAELARRSGRRTAVDFEFVELPAFRRVGELIADRVLGPCHRIDVQWSAPSWSQSHRVWNWKSDRRFGGGVLNLLGTHALHLVERLAGPIVHAGGLLEDGATRRFAPAGAQRHVAADTAHLNLQTRNDVEVHMSLSNRADAVRAHRWVFHCRDGTWMVRNDGTDYARGFHVHDLSGRATRPLDITMPEPRWLRALDQREDGRMAAFGRVAAAWLEGAGAPSFDEAARVQGVIEQLHGSCTSVEETLPAAA